MGDLRTTWRDVVGPLDRRRLPRRLHGPARARRLRHHVRHARRRGHRPGRPRARRAPGRAGRGRRQLDGRRRRRVGRRRAARPRRRAGPHRPAPARPARRPPRPPPPCTAPSASPSDARGAPRCGPASTAPTSPAAPRARGSTSTSPTSRRRCSGPATCAPSGTWRSSSRTRRSRRACREVVAPVVAFVGALDPDFKDPAAEALWLRSAVDAEVTLIPGRRPLPAAPGTAGRRRRHARVPRLAAPHRQRVRGRRPCLGPASTATPSSSSHCGVVDDGGPTGYADLTLAAVAARAGVAVPSLYKHVDGLPGLRRDVALVCVQELAEIMRGTATRSRRWATRRAPTPARRPGRYDAVQGTAWVHDPAAEAVREASAAVVDDLARGVDGARRARREPDRRRPGGPRRRARVRRARAGRRLRDARGRRRELRVPRRRTRRRPERLSV